MARIAAKLAELDVAQAAEQLRAQGASSSGPRRKRRHAPAPPAGTAAVPIELREVRASPARSERAIAAAACEAHLAGLDPELLGEEPPKKPRVVVKHELRVSTARLAEGD